MELDQVHINMFSIILSTYPALPHTFAQDTMTSSNSINIKAMIFPESLHIQAVSIRNYKIYQFLFDIGTVFEHNVPTFFVLDGDFIN